ncbi:YajQ family cyclic di-GMP-binding protein [Thermophilibacter immobilis]|mgnify:CR=1 FL=1|uniref:Nucleotide-binding protein INP52_04650 n=1 Tax=Thermophilibacter immobilis TaxID=2779519 RepID=A0A7S7M9Z3_9ACTN|nr:YajQ family cyclic di-GMP-binding protein [Thermophilibacter immobilis]QOY61476.1 YajQ family cyclic di-GMP-binding protein [Thermophilibacter immobilis]
MAKEASFDIVSVVDMQEVDNAYQQASRELTQRYDLKQTGATLELARADGAFKIVAPSEFVASQVRDVLASKLTRRGIDLAAVRWDEPAPAGNMTVRQAGALVQGIGQDTARQIAKDVRDLKVKAKVTVEKDKLRVSSASRDVLQSVIAHVKEHDYGQPLQFVNYR